MENQTENENSSNDESVVDDSTLTETVDVETLKKERDELATTNRQLFERAKKAEGFVKVDGKWVKAPKPEEAIATAQKLEAKAGELTETQLDYLDLKGINNDEDITIIQKVMQRTGQTVRQALNDDYVKSKLADAQKARDVLAATPSSTKRSGSAASTDVEYWVQKNAQDGSWPSDFSLKAKVLQAKERKLGGNAPAWHS